MWRAVRGAIPGVAVANKRFGTGDSLFGNKLFKSRQPMPIIGLAGVGVAVRLRALDFIRKRPRPFVPTKEPARVQRDRHGEGLGFPWFTKDRPVGVARKVGNGASHVAGGLGSHQAHSRYGSQASIETIRLGSDALPHSSPPSN